MVSGCLGVTPSLLLLGELSLKTGDLLVCAAASDEIKDLRSGLNEVVLRTDQFVQNIEPFLLVL